MSLLKVKAFAPSVSGSGISIALSESKAGQYVRIGITEQAQREYFGGPLDPSKDTIAIKISDEPGRTHLIGLTVSDLEDPDALPIRNGARGSVSMKLVPWRQVPAGKLPARSMMVASAPRAGDVVLKMPEWARPEPRKVGQGRPLME